MKEKGGVSLSYGVFNTDVAPDLTQSSVAHGFVNYVGLVLLTTHWKHGNCVIS